MKPHIHQRLTHYILSCLSALNLESAMKSFGLYSFLMILNESIKLLPKNGKLMALIAIFSIFFSLCFSSFFIYSLKSVVADVLVTFQKSFMPDPDSFPSPDQIIGPLNHLKGDFATLLALEIAFSLAFSIISFFSSVSAILVSAHSYSAKSLSLRELFSIILKTWISPLITSFYTSCLSIGYILSVLILASPLLMCPNLATFGVALFFGFLALILYLYLLVPWTLSIVISVVEESCYGMEGLGKAAGLVKGKRLHGFLLNVVYALLAMIVFKGYKLLQDKGYLTIALILLVIVSPLLKIFEMVAYTVLYCQCKEQNGEEIELHGSAQYSKLPTTIVLANDMA